MIDSQDALADFAFSWAKLLEACQMRRGESSCRNFTRVGMEVRCGAGLCLSPKAGFRGRRSCKRPLGTGGGEAPPRFEGVYVLASEVLMIRA